MADVELSSRCSCLDGSKCLVSYEACEHIAGGFGRCEQSGFVATISAPPDEFHILLDAAGRPRRGVLVLRRCGAVETWTDVAGVHVEAVPDCCCGESAPLDATWREDGSVEYVAARCGARVVWAGGKFALG